MRIVRIQGSTPRRIIVRYIKAQLVHVKLPNYNGTSFLKLLDTPAGTGLRARFALTRP